jgi:hypothetical protein
VASFLGWFAALALGRMPRGLRDSAAWGIGYGAQFWAYVLVLNDTYPSCDPDLLGQLPERMQDPIALTARDEARRSRLTTFFRLPLAFPHIAWLILWSVLAIPVAFANWVVTLVGGTPPAALHRFLAAYLRYYTHVFAFLALVANPFPGFAGAVGSYPVEAEIAPPRRQNRWTVGFRVLLVAPAWLVASAFASLLWLAAVFGWFAALLFGRMPRQLQHAGAQAMRCIVQTHGYFLVLHDAYPYLGPCRLPGFGAAPGAAGPPADPPTASAAFG